MYLRLQTSLAVIYGSFTLGVYIAIQGPSLMDLIELLHVNYDLMSFTLALSSLAYSVGGLLSGFLFNYVSRQIMIALFLFFFGVTNALTPYLTNYSVFSASMMLKMMCAGGIDAGNNVWMLEMWPGKDAWLQALHCAFAVGCALGPLIVEPFLSSQPSPKSSALESGLALEPNSETRIHTPYLLCGLSSIAGTLFILSLYWLSRRQEERQRRAQAATGKAGILVACIEHPTLSLSALSPPAPLQPSEKPAANPELGVVFSSKSAQNETSCSFERQLAQQCISPKVSETQVSARTPYHVMLAIALSAMCLSLYCGVEITSMNYLATFAVTIDLQLTKSTAALMSSALTISFAVGRAIGIPVAAYTQPHKMFYMCCSVMAVGNLFIFLSANSYETYLWCSICVFGIGCGPLYGCIVSFYNDRVAKVTNTVCGIFILGSMFMVAINSIIIGHYIAENALILIVCNLIGSVSLLLLFSSLHLLTCLKRK